MTDAETSKAAESPARATPSRASPEDDRPVVVHLSARAGAAHQIEDAIRHAEARPIAVGDTQAFVAAIDFWFPAIALLDVDLDRAAGDWQAAVRRCKLRPHTRAVPIVVFGDNIGADDATLSDATLSDATQQRATNAVQANRPETGGADAAWPRAQFMAQLPHILALYLDPPIVYPEGWNDQLSDKARTGIEEFNRGEFYEQHEWLEHAWMDETRPIRDMYQGILQVGVAFYHVENGNWPGALKMFRRGLPRLRALPPVCQGLDIAALRAAAETIHREVTALGRDRLHEFDPSRFPSIRLVDA